MFATNSLFRVGWVEVTKPFGYAVPEGRRRAGQRPTNHKIGVGFRYRLTQPTITKTYAETWFLD